MGRRRKLPPVAARCTVVHGPMACGKTHNAQAIAQRFGLSQIVDDWTRERCRPGIITDETLILTYESRETIESAFPFATIIAFDTLGFPPALREARS